MKLAKLREIRVSLIQKINKKERLSLSEVGMRDVLWGKGRRPNNTDFRLPRWMRNKNA